MTRGYRACVWREVRRGQRRMLVFAVIGLIGLLLVQVTSDQLALIPGVLSMLAGVLAISGPLGDLSSDRLHGYFEFDRTLPLSPRVVAAGRLTGAAIRVLPIVPCAIPMLIGFRRAEAPAAIGDGLTFGLLPVVLLLLAWIFVWVVLSLNARWSFRHLWWLPMTLWLLPQSLPAILPSAVNQALAHWLTETGSMIVTSAGKPGMVGPLILLVSGLLLLIFLATTRLFAAGLLHYRYDPSAFGTVLASAPAHELVSVGEGAVLAVARLRLRLSTEQFRRELIILAVLFVVAAAGPGATREFARRYIPLLAALLPGGIALQLFVSRSNGQLEGMQQLPHPRVAIGVGHLLAIAVMALPGSVVLLVTRALDGQAPTVEAAIGLWGWFVAMAWAAAAVGLWIRARYLIYLLGGMTLGIMVWIGLAGDDTVITTIAEGIERFAALRRSLGPAVPLGFALLVAAVGLPVFAFALSRYEHRPA